MWEMALYIRYKSNTVKMRTIFPFSFSHLGSRAVKKVIKINANYHNSVLFITGNILSKILVCLATCVSLFESSL